MQDDDVLYEIRKAKRALTRLETRLLSERRQQNRIAKKKQEHEELKALAEEARRIPVEPELGDY